MNSDQSIFHSGQNIEHIVDIRLSMSGIQLDANRLISPWNHREGEADDQDAVIKKVLNQFVCPGGIPHHQGNDRVGAGDGLEA